MKVLDIYSKKDLELIKYNGESISEMMNNFFLNFPGSYRKLYDKNLENLVIYRVDEMIDIYDNAQYFPDSNVLMFKTFDDLPHELMHMASSDGENKQFAFCNNGIYSLYEGGLIEGMTEFLSCIVRKSDPNTYFF